MTTVVEATKRISLGSMTILAHEAEEGGYWGELFGFPGCVSQGETLQELQENMLEAFESIRPHSEAAYPGTSFHAPASTWTLTAGVGMQTTTIVDGSVSAKTS